MGSYFPDFTGFSILVYLSNLQFKTWRPVIIAHDQVDSILCVIKAYCFIVWSVVGVIGLVPSVCLYLLKGSCDNHMRALSPWCDAMMSSDVTAQGDYIIKDFPRGSLTLAYFHFRLVFKDVYREVKVEQMIILKAWKRGKPGCIIVRIQLRCLSGRVTVIWSRAREAGSPVKPAAAALTRHSPLTL